MEQSFQSNQISRVRVGLQSLTEQAGHHERQLEAAVAAGEAAVALASIALAQPSDPTPSCVDRLLSSLRGQLRQQIDSLSLIRRLCVAAKAQHVALDRLTSDFGADQEPAPRTDFRPRCPVILVVDDYEDNRLLVTACLEDAGFVVRTASNGLEALLAAYEMRPAAIVMDVSMPVLDGVEATRLIKAIDEIRDTPVIAYTAMRVQDDSRVRQLFAAVIQKPVSPDVVVATVQQCAKL